MVPAARDGTVKLWHVPDMTLVGTLNGGAGYRPRVFAVAFRAMDRSWRWGQGGVKLFRISDGNLIRTTRPRGIHSVAGGLAGRPVLAAGSNAWINRDNALIVRSKRGASRMERCCKLLMVTTTALPRSRFRLINRSSPPAPATGSMVAWSGSGEFQTARWFDSSIRIRTTVLLCNRVCLFPRWQCFCVLARRFALSGGAQSVHSVLGMRTPLS